MKTSVPKTISLFSKSYMISLCSSLILTCTLSTVTIAEEARASWNAFQNSGHCEIKTGAYPLQWSPEKNIAWTAEIEGYGQSSPVLAGDQLIVTSTSGDNKEKYFLASYDLKTGKKLWQKEFINPTPKENNNYVSRAAPTAIVDEAGIIAYYEGGLVVAVTQDGTERWKKNLVEEFGEISARHGISSSLEQSEKSVFVWVERSEKPYVLALNKKDGRTNWKSEGVGATSWSSPRLIPVGDQTHLVCSASGKIAGLDPETGKRLWDFEGISNNSSCSPIPVGNGQFLIGASEGRGAASTGNPAESNGVIQVKKQDDGTFKASYAWQAKKATSSFGSPIVYGDRVCFVNRSGVLFQLDRKSGEQLSTTRTAAGGIWATPLVLNQHLYLFGYKGTTSVISLESGKEVAENRIWESAPEKKTEGGRPSFGGGHVLYSAVAISPYIIIRRGDQLYAITSSELK